MRRLIRLPRKGARKKAGVLLLLVLFLLPLTARAEFYPYTPYDYKAYGNDETVSTAAAYGSLYTVGNKRADGIAFSTPRDVAVRGDVCYIADTGANRVVALDIGRTPPAFLWESTGFSQPNGVCVLGDELYVADTGNARIVILSPDGAEKDTIPAPDIEAFTQQVPYSPKKVGVDGNGRVYVVCENITEGFVEIDKEGNFIRYFGANRVAPNPFERFLSRFLTKEQRANRYKPTPVSYSNLTVDSENFVYAATATAADKQVQRLNTQGLNVLKRTDYGDDAYTKIVDVAIDGDENIFALDTARGRVFVYNSLGDRLAIFGGTGDAAGVFREAAALACADDGRILVIDAVKNSLTVFAPTEFGALVLEANRLYVEGRYPEAAGTWSEVLRRNANYRLAYTGVGRARQMERKLEEAMYYFKKGHDRENYSLAFEEYRNIVMNDAFVYVAAGLIGALLALWLLRRRIGRFFTKVRDFVNP